MQTTSFKILTFILLLVAGMPLMAQQSTSKTNDDAVWIKMMDDPNVNYYAAIKAYNDYWLTHPKPADPEDRLTEGERSEDTDKEPKPMTRQQKIYEERMIYQVKRFENWMRDEKPFVQDDGRILSEQERMDIWKKQQEGK